MADKDQPILDLEMADRLDEIHKLGQNIPTPPVKLAEPKLSENSW